MSRSRKKNPFNGICGGSEKEDKRLANRKFRKKSKALDKRVYDLDQSWDDQDEDGNFNANSDYQYPKMREVSNIWNMGKDGKRRIDKDDKLMRK